MSKISFKPADTGTATFTIEAPATNTNRTITLPDEAGSVLTNGGAINVDQSAPAESAVIDSSGNIGIGTSSPAMALDVSGQMRASSGILFGTDTAASNALDDYETGTWTPTISAQNNVTSVVFSLGRYTKIGNLVTITGKVSADVTSASDETRFAITFPFNTANSDWTFAGNVGFFLGSGSNRVGSGIFINPSSTTSLGVFYIPARELNATGPIDIRFTHTYQAS